MNVKAFETPFSFNGLKLFLLGFLILFLELALIRYLPANIWNLGYFPNFVLLAVFLGMGIGFIFHHYLSERGSLILFHLAIVLLLGLIVFVHYFHPSLPRLSNQESEIAGELYFVYDSVKGEDTKILPFAFCFFTIIAIFAFLSQVMAKFFRQFNPLTAYTLDITGSIMGILSFIVISYFRLPPIVWFSVFSVIFLIVLPGSWKGKTIPLLPMAVILLHVYQLDTHPIRFTKFQGEFTASWSPYQRLDYIDSPQLPQNLRSTIWSNGMGHQRIADIEEIRKGFYNIPYSIRTQQQLPPFRNALIIGAGSGNDTAMALDNQVSSVDAVEIDPAIAEFGKRYHPNQPYQDQRVNLVIGDGRAFIANARKKYDLIVFAWADSLIRVSSLSQLRLENYLFTVESIREAYHLLSDQGTMYIFNSFPRPWVGEKFMAMIYRATGRLPQVMSVKSGDFAFIQIHKSTEQQPAPEGELTNDYPTDDWPFLHLRTRSIPSFYLKILVVMGVFVALLTVFVQVLNKNKIKNGNLQTFYVKIAFLFMGIAFMLLETKSVIQFSLLFGTTWLNNSLVFLAVLALVLAANWTASVMKDNSKMAPIFILMFFSCLLPLIYPLGNLLQVDNTGLRFIIASIMTFSPIFFANLIFSINFRGQSMPEHIFGWNLIGAAMGGLLEYSSMAMGYNNLSILVTICYLIVLLMIRQSLRSSSMREI